MGNPEMLVRFVAGFLPVRAGRRDLELRKRAQGRNVGTPPPTVAHICSNDANTDFFCRHDDFSLSCLSTPSSSEAYRTRRNCPHAFLTIPWSAPCCHAATITPS